ncbi:DUF4134 family protein [Flavobacterium sp. CGRL2]
MLKNQEDWQADCQRQQANFKALLNQLPHFLYVIAAIIGVFGAIRVYSKHQNGDQDTNKAMGQWGFAFVFLIAAGFIIKATFSV